MSPLRHFFQRSALICASVLALSACAASIKGRADPPGSIAASGSVYQAQMVDALCDAERAEEGYNGAARTEEHPTICPDDAPTAAVLSRTPSAEQLQLYRNDYAYAMMRAYELALQDYARDMAREGRGGALAQTLADVGLTAGAAISPVSRTQSIFGHLATAVSGLGDGYQKQLLVDNTLPVLLANMASAQLEARARIIPRLSLSAAEYPLSAAKLDVSALGQANTIEAAISRSAGQAEKKKDEAQEKESDVREFRFSENADSRKIWDWLNASETTVERVKRASQLSAAINSLSIGENHIVVMTQPKLYGKYYPSILKMLELN